MKMFAPKQKMFGVISENLMDVILKIVLEIIHRIANVCSHIDVMLYKNIQNVWCHCSWLFIIVFISSVVALINVKST